MLVSSIQKNNINTNFNGLLTIRNVASKKTKIFKISGKHDMQLMELYKKIHAPVEETVDAKIANINNYIDAIYNITQDDFVKNMPKLTKEDRVSRLADFSAKSLYSSFVIGDNYTDIETAKFQISHDMRA